MWQWPPTAKRNVIGTEKGIYLSLRGLWAFVIAGENFHLYRLCINYFLLLTWEHIFKEWTQLNLYFYKNISSLSNSSFHFHLLFFSITCFSSHEIAKSENFNSNICLLQIWNKVWCRCLSFPTMDGVFFFWPKWYSFPFWLKVEDIAL